ncbi:MAG: hypothetical protein KKH12_01645 [Gammaproteobacteria bacterium]|nr:hypothetical protein [Gammaproteobacteria bacterium]MBU1480356.1 hypothetical protein [Gammaproteobacteria bacterium]
MKRIGSVIIVLWALCSAAPANAAQVSIGVSLPHVNIGINFPVFPDLVVVPGYPVYYAPQVEANLFFYDGDYWVYQDDNWYESSWYNGPWVLVEPDFVPVFILRIPVRFYRRPPAYFHGWVFDAPPRWGEHWGHDWERRRGGWDKWDRKVHHNPAPLPVYQRKYSGEGYPLRVEQQHELQDRHYRYQSRDPMVRKLRQERSVQRTPAQRGNPSTPRTRSQQRDGNTERERATIQNRNLHSRSGTVRPEQQRQKTKNGETQSQSRDGEYENRRGKNQDKEPGWAR